MYRTLCIFPIQGLSLGVPQVLCLSKGHVLISPMFQTWCRGVPHVLNMCTMWIPQVLRLYRIHGLAMHVPHVLHMDLMRMPHVLHLGGIHWVSLPEGPPLHIWSV